MGAWGTGNTENDAAMDWLGELEEDPQAAVVRAALTRVADARGQIETPDACEALAAAEVVAAALGRPPSAEEGAGEVRAIAAQLPELAEDASLARRAVAKIRDGARSELHQLWRDHGDEWDAVVADLQVRLRSV